LGAYQCHVFLDWKHLRDDINHPWRELHEHLQGRGVPSLADAMRDLQLKPVHDALYSVLDPSLIRQAFETTRTEGAQVGEKATTASPSAVPTTESASELSPQYGVSGDGRTPGKKQARDVLTLRVQSLLKAVQALVFGESAEPLGVPPQSEWRGTAEGALGSFERWVEAARLIPALEKHFRVAWSTQACFVLPNDAGKENAA